MPFSFSLNSPISFESSFSTNILSPVVDAGDLKSYFRIPYGMGNISKAADNYFSKDKDCQKDLETYFISISDKPPKTVRTFLDATIIYLECYDIELKRKY